MLNTEGQWCLYLERELETHRDDASVCSQSPGLSFHYLCSPRTPQEGPLCEGPLEMFLSTSAPTVLLLGIAIINSVCAQEQLKNKNRSGYTHSDRLAVQRILR